MDFSKMHLVPTEDGRKGHFEDILSGQVYNFGPEFIVPEQAVIKNKKNKIVKEIDIDEPAMVTDKDPDAAPNIEFVDVEIKPVDVELDKTE